MGDPRKIRKKYTSPAHPWNKQRIVEEAEIKKKYAPKNKTEIYKMRTILAEFKDQAKKLSSLNTKQSEIETKNLMKKLVKMGLLKEGDGSEQILKLTLENVMNRRLQTIAFNKGLSRTMCQARQFITHGHIFCNGKVITSPSYLVLVAEEESIKFNPNSSLADPENPERVVAKPVAAKKEEKQEEKKETPKEESKDKKEKSKDKKPRKKAGKSE